ncbi:MAG: hypothetical protein H6Q49_1618, partial [Deltaproteobacteria bacterium]|nr:hypothetical protein [Deltaproteobacteria bacterium]
PAKGELHRIPNNIPCHDMYAACGKGEGQGENEYCRSGYNGGNSARSCEEHITDDIYV